MVPMDFSRLTLDRTNGRTLYLQLSEALAAAIAGGELATGERLPSERDFAEQLGVSRTTVVNAYRELEARGLVRSHVGRGTFVCADPELAGAPFAWRGKMALSVERALDPTLRALVRATAPGTISFAVGVPALDCFPMDLFRRLTDAVMRHGGPATLGLGPTEGHPALRRSIARRYGARPD